MSDSVAWCILAGFKIASVFSRIIYHTIESVCEFAVNILQGYIYEGKESVNFNVNKKIKQRNKKSSIKQMEDESRNEDRKNKNFYCKTNESLMSEDMSKKSTNIDQNMLTISGQRFSFHGTDKIIECNLQDASKVTITFDFYPFKNRSMLDIKTSSRLDAPDSQKKMVETDKPKMSTDPKQPNGSLNQNEIPREASRLKYNYESKLSDEVLNANNMLATKNGLEITLGARDVSINRHGTSYEKVKDPISNEHHLESAVVHVSQDTENLDNKVSHGEDSLGSADKQWPDNHTVGNIQKLEISDNLSCVNQRDVTILAEETRRPTFNQRQINLANSPEQPVINQTTSPFREKQIQQTILENQQSGIMKDALIHSEQYQTLSTPALSYLSSPGIDKLAIESMSDKNKKPLAESPTDKNKLEQVSHNDRSRMSDSLAKDKKPVPSPTANKKPLSENPDSNDKKSRPESEDKCVLSSVAQKKTLSKSPDGSATNLTPAAADEKLAQSFEANKHKPLPPTNELSPGSPDDKEKSSVSLRTANKHLSKSHDSNDIPPEPESDADKTVMSPTVDKKPLLKSSAGNDKKYMPTLMTGKIPTPTPAADKKPAQSLEENEHKRLPVPETNKFTVESHDKKENSSVSSIAVYKKPVTSAVTDKKRLSESPVKSEKMSGTESEMYEKPTPTPITDEKPTPAPITDEEPAVTQEAGQKPALTPETHNEVSKELTNTTKTALEQSINFNAVESNSKAVEEINEGDNTDSSSNNESESQTQSIDADSSYEDFSQDIDEMLEKGPSIVIAPDTLLNPDMSTYVPGICTLDVSNIEMNSKYMQDGWDESDKCFYEYVIQREKEMGQSDPTTFKKEFSNEMDTCDKNNSNGESIQRDSSVLFGEVIDNYNPMTEVPKYYDLIRVVDSKYILEKSLIKCYKKRERIDNFKGAETVNKADDPKDTQNRTTRQSPRETKNADHSKEASAFGESSGAVQESRKNVKTVEELGARPKTYPTDTRK